MLVASFAFGVRYERGQDAIDEVEVVKGEIKEKNKDISETAKDEKAMDKIRIEYREKFVYLPAIPIDNDCPIDQSTELRNESNRAIPEVYFESTD